MEAISVSKEVYKALKHYAEIKGMSVDYAADYLLARDMCIFYDGCESAYKRIEAIKKGLHEKYSL